MINIFSEYGNFPGYGRPIIKLGRNSCRNLGYGNFPGYENFPRYRNYPGYKNYPHTGVQSSLYVCRYVSLYGLTHCFLLIFHNCRFQ